MEFVINIIIDLALKCRKLSIEILFKTRTLSYVVKDVILTLCPYPNAIILISFVLYTASMNILVVNVNATANPVNSQSICSTGQDCRSVNFFMTFIISVVENVKYMYFLLRL